MKEVTFNAITRNKLIKEFIIEKVGEQGLILIEILFKAGKYVSEFTLAERSAIYVNTVRGLLYKLENNKIVSHNRKREKTKGWYIYSWKLNSEKLVAHLINQLETEKNNLNTDLSETTSDEYFYCKDCNVKLSFSDAMEYNFGCPNCFNQMELTSPVKENKKTKTKITDLDAEITNLESLRKRLEKMEAERDEEERKQLEKEEAEREALEKKGMYYCTECNKPHKIQSKIGEEHKEKAK